MPRAAHRVTDVCFEERGMSNIWILVALAAGFVGGLGASIPLQSKADPQRAGKSVYAGAAKSDNQQQGGHAGHDHSKIVNLPAGPTAPTLDFDLLKDTAGGWNLHIKTTHFAFSPETVNAPNEAGRGHAHIYVDDKKLARVYGAWFHIAALPAVPYKLRVTLNANDHSTIAVEGVPLSVTKTIAN